MVCLGEPAEASGESKSRQKLHIPLAQIELVKKLKELQKPIVAVIFGGRPLILTELESFADAMLFVFMPGTEAGNAIANTLYGDVNPSGRLPMSFPDEEGQIPIYYNRLRTVRPKKKADDEFEIFTASYYEGRNQPLYPFGYGLSYTQFKYGKINLSKDTLSAGDTITASVSVKNIGKTAGEETVLLYIQDTVSSFVRPEKELKGFKKIYLEPGKEKTVEFSVCDQLLEYYDSNGNLLLEKGEFKIMIGNETAKFNFAG